MGSLLKQTLDQNGAVVLNVDYDKTSNMLTGGILKAGRDHHANALTENVVDRLRIKLGDDIITLRRAPKDDPDYAYRFDHQVRGAHIIDLDVKLKEQVFGTYMVDLDSSEVLSGDLKHKLAAFETRSLSVGSSALDLPYDRSTMPAHIPMTDLHTHLAGNLPAKALVDLAMKKDGAPIVYSKAALKDIGIKTDEYTQGDNVAVKDLTAQDRQTLIKAMEIGVDKLDTFNGMEQIYMLRAPITKDKALFEPILKAIGEDYNQDGHAATKYAELSHASIIGDPELLMMMHRTLPEVKEYNDVDLRFLAAMWRHSDPEWNSDEVDRIKSIAQSPFVVGADFMGHETNPTADFFPQIKELSKWAIVNDPDFTIRVHAGENPLFADTGYNHDDYLKNGANYWANHNVRNALHAALDARKEVAAEIGVEVESLPMPRLRIGHGLFGLDEETIRLFKEVGAVVEFNMSSNLALNNIDSINEVPIKRYVDAGIPVVLGHDGKGIYQTSPEQEALIAQAAGLTAQDFAKIHETEEKHIARDKVRFERLSVAFDHKLEDARAQGLSEVEAFKEVTKPVYSTPDGKPRMTSEISAAYSKRNAARESELLQRVKKTYDGEPVVTKPEEVAKDLEGKIPVLITGASEKAWPKISPKNQEEIEVAMQVLSNWVDGDKAYLITGGTHHGVEARAHEAVHRSNNRSAEIKSVKVLGAFTAEALALKAGQVAKLEDDTITHATVLKTPGGRLTERWFDLQDAALEIMEKGKGEVIAVGGGPVVRDMIQRAHNTGLSLHLMDGPEGASTDKALTLARSHYGFEGASGLLSHLVSGRPELFREGFDARQIDSYVEEAREQVARSKPGYDMENAKGKQALVQE